MAKPTSTTAELDVAKDAGPAIVRVRALRTGFYGHKVEEQQLRPEGSVFDFHRLPITGGGRQPIPSWCVPVEAVDVPVAAIPVTQTNAAILAPGVTPEF